MIIKFIAYFCFFLSGFAALTHELCWSRILKQIFISESLTNASVLIIFFGGLALGSYLSAKISKFLRPLGDSYTSLFLFSLAQLTLAFLTYLISNFFNPEQLKASLILIPSSILLGSLFPLLSNFYISYTENKKHKNNTVSKIYLVNTFAGLIAIIFTVFFALKYWGLKLTLINLSVLHLSIFILSFIPSLLKIKEIVLEIFDSLKISSLQLSIAKDQETEKPETNYLNHVLWLSFACGFLTFGLELIWMRAFSLILASSVYSFAMVLSSIIFGLSCGTLLFQISLPALEKQKSFSEDDNTALDLEKINWLLIALAALILLSSFSFQYISGWYIKSLDSLLFLIQDFHREDLYRAALHYVKFIIVSIISVPSSLIIGFISSYLLKIFTYHHSDQAEEEYRHCGAHVGTFFSINTLGAILGAALTLFFFIPSLEGGINQSLLILNLIPLLSIALALSFSKSKQYVLFFISGLCFILLVLLKPNFITAKTATGTELYYSLKYKDKVVALDNSHEEVLFHQDGLYSTVSVIKDSFANTIYLKSNAKVEAGVPIEEDLVSAADMQTQVLLGISARYFRDSFNRVLLIGMGSGITLDSLSLISSKAKICVAEIEELIFKAADKFFSNNWKNTPNERITRFIGNARSLLKSSTVKYDLIVSQPSDPWLSVDMFTNESWRLAHSKLSKDGIFVQWLQLYSLEPEYLVLIINTINHNFKNLLIIHPPHTAEIIILASDKSFKFSDFKLEENPVLKKVLNHISIHNSADFIANIMLTNKDIERMLKTELAKTKIKKHHYNTVDNSLLEFHTAENFYKFTDTVSKNIELLSNYVSFENVLSLIDFNSEAERNSLVYALRDDYLKSISTQSLRTRENFYKNKLYIQSLNRLDIPLKVEEEFKEESDSVVPVILEQREARVSVEDSLTAPPQALNISLVDENNYESLLEAGVQNFNSGLYDEAERNFKTALKIDPNLEQAYLYLAQIKLLMKDDNKFLEYINYCLRLNSFNTKALYLAANYNYNFASLGKAFIYAERILQDTPYRSELSPEEISKTLKIYKKLGEITQHHH